MTRQALTCPDCGRTLAYKRQGGSIVPVVPVELSQVREDGSVILWCDQDKPRGFLLLTDVKVVIMPPRSARLMAK